MTAHEIRVIGDRAQVDVAVQLFVGNVDPSYISHGEIMDGRATGPGSWSPSLPDVIAGDFGEAVRNAQHPLADGLHLAGAFRDHRLVGLALYEFVTGRRNRYAVIHDFLVAKQMRRQSLGTSMLNWLERQFREAGHIRHIFLESGRSNSTAHGFFHHHGYRQCSVTMMKEIA